jgi:acyl-CoA synthetase (AMP-forming)/AMP-acid ligase II
MTRPGALTLAGIACGGPGGASRDEAVCAIDGPRRYTRAQVRAAVAHRAAQLREYGIGQGESVLALVDHDPHGVFFLAAASALGLRVLMPYNLQTAALAEWRNIAASARPDAVVWLRSDTTGVDELRATHPRVLVPSRDDGAADPRELAAPSRPIPGFLVLFTSGTTGVPKATSVGEELICRRVASVSDRLKFSADARVFMSGLLNNTTGVIFSFGALLHGAVLIFPAGRDAARWPQQVAAHRATHIMLRPVALRRFLEGAGDADLASLRVVAYGAAPMPRAVLEAGRRRIPCEWVQGYGLSETYGPFCWLDEVGHREGRYSQVYCVGKPDDTLEVRIDPLPGHPAGLGEVIVRGTTLMDGYLDVTTGRVAPVGEWLRTGDLGGWSPAGDLLLKGRIAASVLSSNGHRIYPEEVEAILAEVPEVDEAVLIGLPASDDVAQRPVACLSGRLGGRDPATIRQAVVGTLAPRLTREKWPELVYAATTPFPKSANDKVIRAEVGRVVDRTALIEL